MTLPWDPSALPAGLPVALVDLATGAEVDVRTRTSYTSDVASRRGCTSSGSRPAGGSRRARPPSSANGSVAPAGGSRRQREGP
ncbi:hypothetical protein BSZ37_08420 [Rubrivirga marina]|uniref:Uncharacterized protein n=1 Tax=Rubrivirga marina TaxID=1196024 RepID=A0A271IZ29_9BACT|nr:hypothetical protein BSZ37_08420 [Rubrivirga marina]